MSTISLYTIASAIIVSLLSFIGVFALALNKENLNKVTAFLVSISAGALLGDAFLHLMPEAAENKDGLLVWLWLLGGIILFFILEKIIHWHHCHNPAQHEHEHVHALGKMNLIGDGLHNFLDGLIIAGAFLVNIPLGIATTIAVIAHEIPQEISDFGILIYSGFSRIKALAFNFFSGAISTVGAIAGLLIGAQIENFVYYIVPFAAGGFIYIAAADIIPELHKEVEIKKSLKQLLGILIGIGIMWGLKIWFE
jgi:zinc and cadmium transporter